MKEVKAFKPKQALIQGPLDYSKNTGHLEWNAMGDFSEFKTNGDSKEAL